MISVRILLVSLMPLFLANTCDKHKPPKVELCVSGDDYLFLCNDQRIDPPDYELEYPVNYACTNIDDYRLINNYCTDLRSKLIKCERDLKNR
jgi:hypothetical protein